MNPDNQTVEFIRDQLKQISISLDRLEDDVKVLRDNHIHHLELRVERMETSLRIGWKAIVFGAGVPALISAILSVINLMK
jgi:LPS O-antigen subunit length determinant protein (WzzB/FepE family)